MPIKEVGEPSPNDLVIIDDEEPEGSVESGHRGASMRARHVNRNGTDRTALGQAAGMGERDAAGHPHQIMGMRKAGSAA